MLCTLVFQDPKEYDVGFMLHESASSSRVEWLKKLNFTKEIIKRISVETNGARASVLTFGRDAQLRIRFDDHTNYDSFARAIDRLDQRHEGTNIIEALK